MEENEDFIKINFKEFLNIIKENKKALLVFLGVFIVIGLGYSLSLINEFTTQGKILPEYTSKSGLSKLSGLASLAGVDIGSAEGTDAIRPDLYPEVLKSTPFYLTLLAQKVKTKNNKEIVFEQYYKNTFEKEGILSKILGQSKEKQVPISPSPDYIVLDKKQDARIKDLQKRVVPISDKKTGIITIEVKMPDPVVAASVASFSMKYLIDYVIKYRTAKAQKNAEFIEEQMLKAKGKYYNTQAKKAQYSDFQQPFTRIQSANLQKERIESEYNISASFYNTLASQHEKIKLQVQEETPVIKILEPPRVPVTKSEPARSIIMIGFTILGAVLGLIYALLKNKNYQRVFEGL